MQGQWLVDASSFEIRAHRLIFLAVLGPLLGLWLPHLLSYLALAILIQAASGSEGVDGSWWQLAATIASYLIPLIAVGFGLRRESRALAAHDRAAIARAMPMPPRQGAQLAGQLKQIWDILTGGRVAPPRLICQPSFDVLAHAYEDKDGQAIEVSAGLASRAVQADPLALSILRHEVAHLVHHDLPAVRRQSAVTGGAILSIDSTLTICAAAVLGVLIVTDLKPFPVPATTANIVAVHLAILLAAAIVTLPLVLGRFVLRRYAGFIVALVEMRADVSAGIWGEGLHAFSSRLESDPGIRTTTLRDVGLAYVSPFLSHLPARARAALLADPARLATPKLGYFAIAVGVIWFLNFHQGSEVWDFFLLAAAAALLQALAIQMILTARGRLRITPGRAGALAAGLLAAQALPLISIEGLAYLAEHLTAALVRPGGFGSAGDTSYLQDTMDTFNEFGRFASRATGGLAAGLSILLAGAALWVLPRLPGDLPTRPRRVRTMLVAAVSFSASLLVSYKFFQEPLYWPVRKLAFASSDPASGVPTGFWALLPDGLRHLVSRGLWDLSEILHGPPFLETHAWFRLTLPLLAGTSLAVLMFGVPRRQTTAQVTVPGPADMSRAVDR